MRSTDNMDRRMFIKGTTAAAAGLTLFGASTAFGSEKASTATDIESWDKEVQILVVGSGTATMAALAAAYYGAKSVLIAEKNVFGGTSTLSAGACYLPLVYTNADEGIVDSRDEVIKYMKNVAAGREDEGLLESYVDSANPFAEWTKDAFGYESWHHLDEPFMKAFGDYYPTLEGALPWGRGETYPYDANGDLVAKQWDVYRQMVDESEVIELMEGTEVTSLVTDASGVVIGAVASDGTSTVRIKADAVILGTGGFDHNADMRAKHLQHPLYGTVAVEGNTGDGHRMAAAIGAQLANMDTFWGLPFFYAGKWSRDTDIVTDIINCDWVSWRGLAGCIVVNKYGKRFGDESGEYPLFARGWATYSTDTCEYSNIPGFFICDADYVKYNTLPGQSAATDPLPEYFVSADTIEELATSLGIDPDGLSQEIDEFNSYAENGEDPKFHRGEKESEILTFPPSNGGGTRTDVVNLCVGPVKTPPFYGAVYVPGTCGTSGGIRIDENAQALNYNGEPIGGLYAAGNCTQGVCGGQYCGSGITIGSGLVMSWVAAKHILGV